MSTNRTGASDKVRPIRTAPRRRWSRFWWIVLLVFLAVIIIPSLLSEMITDWMWFGSQNLAEVYTTRLWLALGVFFGAGILGSLLLFGNWMLAWRLARPTMVYPGQAEPLPRGPVRWITLGVAIALGLFMGLVAAEAWPTILLYAKGGSFGQTDPLFGNDIGFYVFSLPFYKLLKGWAMVLLVIAAIGTAIIYVLGNFPQISQQLSNIQTGRALGGRGIQINLGRSVGAHLTVLGAIFLALIGVGYWFDRYDLLYSSRAVAYGAGYTDVNAKLPALNILMVITAVMLVLLLINIRVRTWRLLIGALGIWLVAFVVVGNVYPAIIQQWVVKPSESELEKPYIINNINATRQAFGLDKFSEHDVPAVSSITSQQVAENSNIVNNIRLWDYRPLLDTYNQLQSIRSYYTFGFDSGSVDIDRYTIGGVLRQVMLAGRELSIEAASNVNSNLLTWENLHVRYTHGYGAVVSPVNEIEW